MFFNLILLPLVSLGLTPHTSGEGNLCYFDKLWFSQRLSRISVSESADSARAILVKPSFVIPAFTVKFKELWCYCRAGSTYPGLGTIVIDTDGSVLKVFGQEAPSRDLAMLSVDVDALSLRIEQTRGLGAYFSAQRTLTLSRDIANLGPLPAATVLNETLRTLPMIGPKDDWGFPDVSSSPVGSLTKNECKVGLICLTMLGGKVPKSLYPDRFYSGTKVFNDSVSVLQFVRGVPVVTMLLTLFGANTSYERQLVARVRSAKRFADIPSLDPSLAKLVLQGFMTGKRDLVERELDADWSVPSSTSDHWKRTPEWYLALLTTVAKHELGIYSPGKPGPPPIK